MATGIRWATLLEDNPLTVVDHVKMRSGANAVDITQALLSATPASSGAAIAFRVFEYASQADLLSDTGAVEIGTSANVSVATAVFDTLQTNELWTDNGGDPNDGFNLLIDVPPARFPDPSKWYRIEITITPVTGNAFKLVWAANTTPVSGS